MQIHEALRALLAGRTLSAGEAEAVFEQLLTGRLEDAQIAALLALLQARPVAVEELVGAARVMRRHVTPVPASAGATLVDTCGTGGAPKTFNVSTAAAIVAAAAGGGKVRVAKHGNRSRTGRGSAEVLAALGVNVDATPQVQARCLDEAGVCFCFAIHHHPAMRYASGPRKALGFPTIFNLLGPLTNPAGARRQLLGVYDRALVEPVAAALAQLGAERAMVVHGADGLDEISTTGPTVIATVERGAVAVNVFHPAPLGMAPARVDDLKANDLADAAAIIRDVLAGKPGPARDIVALNAAAALMVAGAAENFARGVEASLRAIDEGRGRETLERLVRVSSQG